MKSLGALGALKNTFSVLAANLGPALFIAMVAGGLGAVIEWAFGEIVGGAILSHMTLSPDPAQRNQTEMIVTMLTFTVFAVIWSGPVGAWQAGSSIYLWVQREKGREATLRGAINFGLNRLSRVLGPHWKAYLFIALGNLVVVPAILLGLQYAFVDCIATLDDQESDPLARSKRLTLPRRGTIFRTFLPFALWWIPYQLALTFWMDSQPLWVQAIGGTIDALVLVAIDITMVQLYLDVFRKPASGGPGRSVGQSAAPANG
jgi:hypothetical protein